MKHRSAQAFTLVELLAVIAAIAVLIALLLPALNIARQEAQTVLCLSNLRQLGLAAANYTASYEGSYPPAYYGFGNPSWAIDMVRNVQTNIWTDQPGILWMGQTNLRVLVCPAVNETPVPGQIVLGYNYNTSYIGHGALEYHPAPATTGQVQDPARCALFGDGGYSGGINYWMRAPDLLNPIPPNGDAVSPAERAAGTQAFRHLGATNVVYCDGHAATQKHRYTQTAPYPAYVGPGTGFLSPDNSAYQTY